MFKYLRTLNNDSHPTEIKSFISPAGEDDHGTVNAGSIISVTFGEVSPIYTTSTPRYLAISSKTKEETAYVKCIRVTADMIFEADVEPGIDSSVFFLGAMCDAAPDSTGKGVYVTRDGAAKFEIIDISNIGNGKVTIVVL